MLVAIAMASPSSPPAMLSSPLSTSPRTDSLRLSSLAAPSNLLPDRSLHGLSSHGRLSNNVAPFQAPPRLPAAADMHHSPFLIPRARNAALPLVDFDAPQQRLGVVDELVFQQQPPLSAPTMHPNLVSTLRSIISPPMPSAQPLGPPEVLDDLPLQASSVDCRPRCSSQGRIGDLADDRCSTMGLHKLQTTFTGSFKQPEDQSQAAIVPIDLIQNRRPFQCAFPGCNKTFKNPQTLKMHYKTHYSEDSAYCKGVHSPAVFPPSCRAGHNKKIPSKCPICRRTFVGLYELRRHFGRKHSEGEKSHGCKKCGKKFYIEVDLRDHEKLCGEPLECKCGIKFAFKCNLVAHKKAHPDCQELSGEEEGGTAGAAGAQPSFHSNSFRSEIPSREPFHPNPVVTETASSSPSFLALGQPPASCSLYSIPHNSLLRSISCGIWPSHV